MTLHACVCNYFHFMPCNPSKNRSGLLDNEVKVFKNELGLEIQSESDMEVDELWQHKDPSELKMLPNDQLKKYANQVADPS